MKKIFLLFLVLFTCIKTNAQVYSDTLAISDSIAVVISYNDGTAVFNCHLRYIDIEKYGKTFFKTPLIIDTADKPELEPEGKIYSGLKITSRPKDAIEYVAFRIGKNEYIYSYGINGSPQSLKLEVDKDADGTHNDNHE